jgi:DNA-binding transcriptional LysR family regulator
MELVVRSRQGVTLTQAAQVALRRFRIALTEVDSARAEVMHAASSPLLRLRVGCMTLAMLDVAPRAVGLFLASAENRGVELVEDTADELFMRLVRGELDLAIGRTSLQWARAAESRQLEQRKLFDEPRCVVCRVGHPLGRRRLVDLPTLAKQRWALPPTTSSARTLFDELFASRGMTPPRPVVESASVLSNVELAAVTDLLVLTPLAVAQGLIRDGRVRRLPCAVNLPDIAISAIWRVSCASDPLVVAFLECLLKASRRKRRA